MSNKALNLIGKVGEMAATVSPADFELGSPESRAAARAIAHKRRELSEEDRDCLSLFGFWPQVNYRVVGHDAPGFKDSALRGMEISQLREGPIIPSHEDPHSQRCTGASLAFEDCFRREPDAGDILTRNDVESHYGEAMMIVRYHVFKEVWERRVKAPFPFKVEDGKVWVHTVSDGSKPPTWQASSHEDAAWNWRRIAEEALYGYNNVPRVAWERDEHKEWESVEAVKFVEPEKGKHCCKPYKAAESVSHEERSSDRIGAILEKCAERADRAGA